MLILRIFYRVELLAHESKYNQAQLLICTIEIFPKHMIVYTYLENATLSLQANLLIIENGYTINSYGENWGLV